MAFRARQTHWICTARVCAERQLDPRSRSCARRHIPRRHAMFLARPSARSMVTTPCGWCCGARRAGPLRTIYGRGGPRFPARRVRRIGGAAKFWAKRRGSRRALTGATPCDSTGPPRDLAFFAAALAIIIAAFCGSASSHARVCEFWRSWSLKCLRAPRTRILTNTP